MPTVQIQIDNENQFSAFVTWFKESGFEEFYQNDHVNDDCPREDLPTCLATDEEVDSGHYFEIQ